MRQILETEDHVVGPPMMYWRSLLPDERQRRSNKGAEQSRWKNLRSTDPGAIGVRTHTTAKRSDIQYRNLLRLRGDQNSEHLAFLVHDYGFAI